jgi:hypothetical protein
MARPLRMPNKRTEQQRWLPLRAFLKWYVTRATPTAWSRYVPAEVWVPLRAISLLACVPVLYSASPSSVCLWLARGVSAWLMVDIMLANTGIALVTKGPDDPLRSIVLTFASFVSLIPGWAALAAPFGSHFEPKLTAWSSLHRATSIFMSADWNELPKPASHWASALVVAGHLLQFWFLIVIVTVVIGWATNDEGD